MRGGVEKRIFRRAEEVSPAELKVRKYKEKMVEREYEKIELENNTKDTIKSQAPAEIERRLTDWANKKWFPENKKTIRDAGYDPETKDIGEIRRATEELGGFSELFTEEKFFGGKKYESTIAPLCVLAGVCEKIKEGKPLSGNEMRGILYLFNERAKVPRERLEEEIRALPDKKGISEEELEKEVDKQLKVLFEARKNLAEKIRGRNLEKECLEKGEKNYIETRFSEMFGDFQKEDYIDYLRAKDYNVIKESHLFKEPFRPGTERPGTLSIRLIDPEGNISKLYTGEKLIEEEIINFLKEKTFNEAKSDFKKEWEELDPPEKDEIIKDFIEKEIEKAAKPIEMARGKGFEFWKKGPEVVYGTIKDRLAKEAEDEELSDKKPEEIKKINERLNKKGKDVSEAIDTLREVRKKAKGDRGKDEKLIRKNVEDLLGVPIDHSRYEEIMNDLDAKGLNYEKLIKREEFGLLYFIEFIFHLILGEEKMEEALTKPKE